MYFQEAYGTLGKGEQKDRRQKAETCEQYRETKHAFGSNKECLQ